MWGGACAAEKGLELQWSSQESSGFPRSLQVPPQELREVVLWWGLGVYKYLQIFLVLVDVVELEDMRVFNELQDGDLPLYLGAEGRVDTEMEVSMTSPSSKASPSPSMHSPSSAPTRTASPGSRS